HVVKVKHNLSSAVFGFLYDEPDKTHYFTSELRHVAFSLRKSISQSIDEGVNGLSPVELFHCRFQTRQPFLPPFDGHFFFCLFFRFRRRSYLHLLNQVSYSVVERLELSFDFFSLFFTTQPNGNYLNCSDNILEQGCQPREQHIGYIVEYILHPRQGFPGL